jgi:hypothetical protein
MYVYSFHKMKHSDMLRTYNMFVGHLFYYKHQTLYMSMWSTILSLDMLLVVG